MFLYYPSMCVHMQDDFDLEPSWLKDLKFPPIQALDTCEWGVEVCRVRPREFIFRFQGFWNLEKKRDRSQYSIRYNTKITTKGDFSATITTQKHASPKHNQRCWNFSNKQVKFKDLKNTVSPNNKICSKYFMIYNDLCQSEWNNASKNRLTCYFQHHCVKRLSIGNILNWWLFGTSFL